jgi:hypothetical protein
MDDEIGSNYFNILECFISAGKGSLDGCHVSLTDPLI